MPSLSPPSSAVLAKGQVLLLVASGIVIWALAWLLLRAIAPLGWLSGAARPWAYAATLAGTWPVVLAVVRLARLGPAQVVPGVALVTVMALFIDGAVFGWAPSLYAAPAWQLDCAATVLWGAGCGLILGFVHAQRMAARAG